MPVTNLKTSLTSLREAGFACHEPADKRSEEYMVWKGLDRYRRHQDRLSKRGTAAERDDYASVIRQSLLGVAERIAKAIVENEAAQAKRRRLPL